MNARTSDFVLPDTKHRNMLCACWWAALAVICSMWCEGDNSDDIITPSPCKCEVLFHWHGVMSWQFPINSMLHLLFTDRLSCHSGAWIDRKWTSPIALPCSESENGWPWMTLNGVMAVTLRYFTTSLNLVNLRCRKQSVAEFMQKYCIF